MFLQTVENNKFIVYMYRYLIKDLLLTIFRHLYLTFSDRRTVFPLFLCVAGLLSASSILTPSFLAPLAKDAGLTPEQRGLLLSITGGAGMVSRITLSLLADKQFIKLTTILAAVSVVVGVTVHLLRFVHGFGAFVAVAIVMGVSDFLVRFMF